MSRPVSRVRIIGAIVRKDLAEYGKDRLWAFLTVVVLVMAIGLFWILPDDVDESIDLGISGLDDPALLSGLESTQVEGVDVALFATEEDLEAVVAGNAEAYVDGGRTVVVFPGSDEAPPQGAEKRTVGVGIAFPADFIPATASGEKNEVNVYVDAAVAADVETAVSGLVRELANAVAGNELPVTTPAPDQLFVVVGQDRVGDQASIRDGFRPVFVFLILLMEAFVMSSLIAREIQARTVTALLVTPATIGDVLAAKGITGAVSGLAQAVIVLAAIGSLTPNPVLVLTLMLLGSVMVSGTAMLAGSSGRDFISTLFTGMVYMIPLLIPAFAALFPGTASLWVRVIPSYPLVHGLVDVTTFGAGWSETLPELGLLLVWCVGLFALGWVVLKRKVQAL